MCSDESAAVLTDFWKHIEMVVMRCRTDDVASAQSTGDSPRPRSAPTYARSLPPGRDGSVEIVSDGMALLKKLKTREGRDICIMGAGELGTTLLEASSTKHRWDQQAPSS